MVKPNVTYKVRTKEDGWLPEVTNLKDYAGIENHPITDIAIKKVPRTQLFGFSDEQNAFIQEQHKELLKIAKELDRMEAKVNNMRMTLDDLFNDMEQAAADVKVLNAINNTTNEADKIEEQLEEQNENADEIEDENDDAEEIIPEENKED